LAIHQIACRNADAQGAQELRPRNGTPGAARDRMASKTKRPSEAWTVPFHVLMWTTITVGFIMTFVVLLMRR
jgi:hypothetical protein